MSLASKSQTLRSKTKSYVIVDAFVYPLEKLEVGARDAVGATLLTVSLTPVPTREVFAASSFARPASALTVTVSAPLSVFVM
jgi:hypothetical protein